MQEHLEDRSVVLATRTAKMTAQVLANLMRATLKQVRKSSDKAGQMSFKQLSKGGALSNIEITEGNIKAFDPIARKYGVHYKLQKDNSVEPPKWLVYFRSKEVDSMTAAFKEFSSTVLHKSKEKPSARGTMQKFREVLKNAVRTKTKHKQREGPEL